MPINRDRNARLAKEIEPTAAVDPSSNLLRHKDGTEESIPDFDTDSVWFERLIAHLKGKRLLVKVAAVVFSHENEHLIQTNDPESESKLCALIESEAPSKQAFIAEAAYRILTSH